MKNKIIDCFLFFQELDILEIRLDYLDNYVDFFVVLESSTSFSGKDKEFILEKNLDRFSKYRNKLIYYKLDSNFKSYAEIMNSLSDNNEVDIQIKKSLKSHTYYHKSELHWLLESFQRESLIRPLYNLRLSDNDIVIISDLDEIMSSKLMEYISANPIDNISTVELNEFTYFANLKSEKKWKGQFFGKWKNIKKKSLNVLRKDTISSSPKIEDLNFSEGGYHFTYFGSKDLIKNKILSGGHQELNNMITINNIEKNMKSGKDIFGRNLKYNYVNVENDNHYDDKMLSLIKNYDYLFISEIKKQRILDFLVFSKWVKILRLIFFIKIQINKIFKNNVK